MKTGSRIIAIGAVALCALAAPAPLLAASADEEVRVLTAPVPDEAIRFARYSLDSFVQNYYVSQDPAVQAQAGSNVTLGNGFQIYRKHEDGPMTPADCIRFPVYHEGKILFFMDVGEDQGRWFAVAGNGPDNTNEGLNAMEGRPGTYVMAYGPGQYTPFSINKVDPAFRIEENDETVLLFPAPDSRDKTAYRLYNPNSGEHFYTQDMAERESLAALGWKKEEAGWFSPLEGTPVYRLYNPNSGEHHYTMDPDERQALARIGWKDEGKAFASDDQKRVPVYRLFNPAASNAGSHHYTTNQNEARALIDAGWKDEGTGWFADLGGWPGQ